MDGDRYGKRLKAFTTYSAWSFVSLAVAGVSFLAGCRRNSFPDVPQGYREYAYVSNTAANTLSVLDLVNVRPDRTIRVGTSPSGLAVNPQRNEVYVVNTEPGQASGSVSVINAQANEVVSTIPVHRLPSTIAVDATGHRAYVPNTGSDSVSVIDLDRRRVAFTVAAGQAPGLARVSQDGQTVVVTNRGSGTVSVYQANAQNPVLILRTTFGNCPGVSDAVILPDSTKVFAACSAGHQVMVLGLATHNDPNDRFLTFLDVGPSPVNLAIKPDGGEIFVSNFGGGTISEIATQTNEVGGTYPVGTQPSQGIVSRDNGTLWVSNSGADTVSIYSIDDGKLAGSLRLGAAPDALAFSADQHLLLAADTRSGDIAVIRTQGRQGPTLFTMLPAGKTPGAIVTKALRP